MKTGRRFAAALGCVGSLLGCVAAGCGGSSSSAGSAGVGAAGAGIGGAGASGAGASGAGASGAGVGGAGVGGAGVGGAGVGGAGVGGAGAAGAGTAGRGGAGGCDPVCGTARVCCEGQCINPANDPKNCGACGKLCSNGTYCGAGECVTPPCEATCAGDSCCGMECCAAGQLCCDPQGPLSAGPHCVAPRETGTCPMGCAPLCVCAAPDTPIATPQGERSIASLRVGDLVYSVDARGITVVPIVAVKRTEVSRHHVMRVELATGATLEISGGHPTADGRRFSALSAGARLDGVAILSAEKVSYAYSATYDILPGSSTGSYFAGGALIGSTLGPGDPVEVSGACVGAP